MTLSFDPDIALQELDAFESEAQARLRAIMRELQQEFRTFLDQLLRDEVARFEGNLEQALGRSVETRIGEQVGTGIVQSTSHTFESSGGSLLGDALNGALNNVLGSLSRGGRVSGTGILRAGATGLGRVLGNAISDGLGTESTIRYSRSQLSQEALGEIGKGRRNG